MTLSDVSEVFLRPYFVFFVGFAGLGAFVDG